MIIEHGIWNMLNASKNALLHRHISSSLRTTTTTWYHLVLLGSSRYYLVLLGTTRYFFGTTTTSSTTRRYASDTSHIMTQLTFSAGTSSADSAPGSWHLSPQKSSCWETNTPKRSISDREKKNRTMFIRFYFGQWIVLSVLISEKCKCSNINITQLSIDILGTYWAPSTKYKCCLRQMRKPAGRN